MQFDLVIVGGGLAGLSLACALRETRLKIALVETLPPPVRPAGWDARVYAITSINAEFLQRIGIWKHLDLSRIASIQAMHVFGDAEARLNFSAYETGLSELGWIVESSLMACELWENAKRQGNLTVFRGLAPVSLKTLADNAVLELNDRKTTLHAKLIVGADGRDSWIRKAAGLTAMDTPYGEMGLVANFECTEDHRHIARQWFRRDGVLAWLPLPGRRISIVWSTPEAHARELMSLPPEELSRRVAAAGEDKLGALTLITPPAAFPLRLMRVPESVAPRLALIGDAAHGIHPLSGHGINLGFQDARVLAERLIAAPEWEDIGGMRLLNSYRRARKEETLLMQTATHLLHRLFHETLPGIKTLRNVGMSLTNRLPWLKDLLIRYAAGAL